MQLTECLKMAMGNGFRCAGFYGNPMENHVVQHWASLERLLILVSSNPKYTDLNHDHWVYGKFAGQIFVHDEHWTVLHLYREGVEQKLSNAVKAEQEAEKKRLKIAKSIVRKRELQNQTPQDWWDTNGWGLS